MAVCEQKEWKFGYLLNLFLEQSVNNVIGHSASFKCSLDDLQQISILVLVKDE